MMLSVLSLSSYDSTMSSCYLLFTTVVVINTTIIVVYVYSISIVSM